MAITFECPVCGKQMAAKSDYAGKQGKCKCGTPLIVPGNSEKMKFACIHCGKGISVSTRHAGKQGKCPTCREVITVPQLGKPVTTLPAVVPLRSAPSRAVAVAAAPATVSAAAAARPAAPVKSPPHRPELIVDITNVTCLMCNTIFKAKQGPEPIMIECPRCASYVEVPGTAPEVIPDTPPAESETAPGSPLSTGKTTCPSCLHKMPDDAPVCTRCGIFVKSGRPILTACDADADELEDKAYGVVRYLSWIMPSGIFPVYSEAMGTHRPYATWAIAALTVLISVWFLALEWTGSPKMMTAKNLMLWNDNAQAAEPDRIFLFYEYTSYGDADAFIAKREELAETTPEAELDAAALNALTPQQQCFGKYRHGQLLTHAFLHGGIFHLAGNMLFLLVFGSRVNAAVGNIIMVILYPLLAVAAAVTHMASMGAAPPTPMLGASGAVMGLAGVYLLLYPIHKVFMVGWIRWGLITGFHLSFKCFAVRGFWVVLFYIMFDVIAVSLMMDDGTAHWAHIGGLIWGIIIAFGLLTARLVYSRNDIFSLIFGKYAWRIIGTPADRMK